MNTIWIVNLSAVFLLCIFLSGIVIPQILLIAFRRRLFDQPNERKIHNCVVPRLGGIAFKPVIFFSFALLLAVNISIGHDEFFNAINTEALPLTYAFCAILMLYLVGIADDLIGVRYRAKFFIQIVCGIMLISGDMVLSDLHGLFFLHHLPEWASIPLTIFAIVFIINAINLIDGIDGLASGLCSIAFLFYGFTFIYFHQYVYAMLSFATVGVLIPFYYYNVFGNAERGRKIFMGDTGSLTIGIMLCFLSIRILQISDGASWNPVALAFAPLLIPCLDVVRVYFHRIRTGKNPFLPDKNHIHHKLLALGMRQRTAMVTIVLASTLLTLINIGLSAQIDITLLFGFDILAWTIANMLIDKRISFLKKNI